MKTKLSIFILFFILMVSLPAQDYYKVEFTAQEILARVDDILKYPSGELNGTLMHIQPDGKSTSLRMKAAISGDDSLFSFSNVQRGDQLKILYNLNGEDIWVYDLLSLKLFHKMDVDKYDPLFGTNYNFLDLSNADFQSNYTAKVAKVSTYKGKQVIILNLEPIFKEGKYGKLTLYVVRNNYIPMRIDYHDRDNVLVKTMSIAKTSSFKNGKIFPVRYDMLHISSGTLSILEFSNYDDSISYKAETFRHENLGNIK